MAAVAIRCILYNKIPISRPIVSVSICTPCPEQIARVSALVMAAPEIAEMDLNPLLGCMCVIFGSPGLFANWEVYEVLDQKMKTCKKPIFPIIPSIINVKEEIADFIQNKHRINFPEECVFGNALCKVYNTPKPQPEHVELPKIDVERITSSFL